MSVDSFTIDPKRIEAALKSGHDEAFEQLEPVPISPGAQPPM
jgi:hypothetical protein